MNDIATGVATLATSGAALFVLLLYAPSLEAPFLVPKFAALELAACLGCVAMALRLATARSPRWSCSIASASLLVLVTTAASWAAAAARPLGAPYAVAAMTRWGSVFGLALGASVLDMEQDPGEARARLLAVVTVAAFAVGTIGLLQHAELLPITIPVISTPGSTFGNRNAAADVMAVALPLAIGATAQAQKRGGKAMLFAGVAVEFVYLAVTRTRGAWLAGACGVGLALWLVRPRWSRASRALALGVVLAAGIAAAVPGRFNPRDEGDSKRYADVLAVLEDSLDAHSTAVKTRLGLWRRTLAMLREHPFLGVGPGNWPVEFPRYAEPGAATDGVLSPTLAPRQAHNDTLERAAETGIVGLGALAVLAWACARAIRERLRSADSSSRATVAGAAGALLSVLVLGVAGFPLEEPGTLALTGLSLGLIATALERRSEREARHDAIPAGGETLAGTAGGPRHRGLETAAAAAGVALLVAVGSSAETKVRSNFWLGRAEHAMHQGHGTAATSVAVSALARSLAATPNNYRGQLRMAQLKIRQQQPAESERAARRAIAIEPYAPNAWASLAAAELAADQFQDARRDASTALSLLYDFPFALDLRARAAERDGDSESAVSDRHHLRTLATGTGVTASEARSLLQPIH